MASGETKPHELVDLSPSDPPPQNNPIFPTKAGSSKPTAVHIDRIDVQTPYHASPQQPTLSTEAHQKLRAVLGDHILSNTVSEHLRKDANEARSQTANQEENYYMITFYQEYMCGNKSRLMRDLEEVRVATHGESDIEIIMTSKSGDIYRTYRSSTRAIDPLYVVPSYNPMVAPFDPSNAKAFIDEIHSFLVNYERACLCLKNVLSGAGTQVLLDDAPDGIPRDVLRTLSNLAEASDKILKDITDLGIAVKVVKERMEQEVLGVLFSHKDGASWQDVDAVKERLKGLAQRVDRMEGRINFELVQRANALIQRASNILSIDEAFKSRQLATSMKRLSWITFIFLPLLFVASLYGMNVDILDNNRAKWWTYVILASSTSLLVFSTVYIWKYRRPILELLGRLYTRIARNLPLRKRRTNWILDEEADGAANISDIGRNIVLMNMCFQAIRNENEATASSILSRTSPKGLVQALRATPGDNAPFTCFLLAVRQESESLTKFVKECGVVFGAKDRRFGWSILHHAVFSGSVRAVKMVLREDGVVVDAKDEGGRTPLHLAFLKGNMEAVELLLRSGADAGAVDELGRVPMDYAPQNRRGMEREMLEELPKFPKGLDFSALKGQK